MKTIVAFANSVGGTVIIGQEDNGNVVGVDDRIEVENPGILLPGMTIEDMKTGVSGMRLRFTIPTAERHSVETDSNKVEAQVDKDILKACSKRPLSSSEIASVLGHKKKLRRPDKIPTTACRI